jgi:hypothetical protein
MSKEVKGGIRLYEVRSADKPGKNGEGVNKTKNRN